MTPTFPFYKVDSELPEKFEIAYTKMNLALATEVKVGVTFGHDYKVVNITVYKQTIDEYEMFYNLISYAHPNLMRNKATRPSKPTFDGDIRQHTTAYRSCLTFQVNREKSYYYDHDNRTNDVIIAIKNVAISR